jgi:hypothetical protein
LTVNAREAHACRPQVGHAVYELAGGVPRRINRICDLSMLMAYAHATADLGREQVECLLEGVAGMLPGQQQELPQPAHHV